MTDTRTTRDSLGGTPWEHDLHILGSTSGVVGIDEVGRGCVAGPIVACAASLTSPEQLQCLRGLPVRDSKTLSPKWRQKILAAASSFSPVFAWRAASDIDRLGIDACNLAIFRELVGQFPQEHAILVDGQLPGFPSNVRTLVHGESTSVMIALASIFAKEHRDSLLQSLDADYPEFGFAAHKGYGTPAHLAVIKERGLIAGVHRRTFLRRFA